MSRLDGVWGRAGHGRRRLLTWNSSLLRLILSGNQLHQAHRWNPQPRRWQMEEPSKDVTRLLREWKGGSLKAQEEVLQLAYDELHRLARHYMARERRGHTLQPTALVHEACLRLVDQKNDSTWENRRHFFAVAALAMRRVLVDHARERLADKRGGGEARLPLDEALSVPSKEKDAQLVALDDALTDLARQSPEQSQVVELRYFGGLTVEETAEVLEVSSATVNRRWAMAKAWLRRALDGGSPHDEP